MLSNRVPTFEWVRTFTIPSHNVTGVGTINLGGNEGKKGTNEAKEKNKGAKEKKEGEKGAKKRKRDEEDEDDKVDDEEDGESDSDATTIGRCE